MTEPPNKSKRRWYRIRLRTLLILTTIVAGLFGWWSYKARQQREAVAALAILGKSSPDIRYDFQMEGSRMIVPQRPPHWPVWLVDALGVDYFANVVDVNLYNMQVTDAGLTQIQRLPAVRRLGLNNTKVSDADLSHLRGLTALEGLDLHNTEITDSGLEYLKRLNLYSLDLRKTHVTDAGLQRLKGFTTLKYLYLGNTKITKGGLEHLKSLTSLYVLDLSNTNVTDAGLEHLKRLTALQTLELENTHVTDAGMARLQAALPNCNIER